MHTFCLINGEIKNTNEPIVKINDLGLLRGYGVFDFFPVKSSEPVFYNDYWNRFRNSANKMRLPFKWEQDQFLLQLHDLFEKNEVHDGYCRILLTGGYSSNGFLPDGSPNLIVMTQDSTQYPEKHYKEGIKLITLDHTREYPEIKSINYMTVLLARDRLRDENAEDVLYLSGKNVTESSRSNFFIIDSNGVLKTPLHDVLAGITRKKVLDIASGFMDIQVTDISLENVKDAHSAFITSTTKGIMPVTRIDNAIINDGIIHPTIKKLQDKLANEINEYIEKLVTS